jgi:hypothetical protein
MLADYRGRGAAWWAEATVTVAFFAWASCSMAVGRANEATLWNRAKVIARAAAAFRSRIEREVRFMAVLDEVHPGMGPGEETVRLKALVSP